MYPELTVTSVAKEYVVVLRDDPYYYYHYAAFMPRTTASLSYGAVTAELAARLEDARAENAYYERELKRGELAFCPETMQCWECGGFNGVTAPEHTVVALGPVTNRADPTATYRLSCGHLAF